VTALADATVRARAAKAVTDYTAADKRFFDLCDYFYAGDGQALNPAQQAGQTIADWYGIPPQVLNTMAWRTRSNRVLNKLAVLADAVDFWNMTGPTRDRARQQIILSFIDDIAQAREQ
jgi:hypothetical protein